MLKNSGMCDTIGLSFKGVALLSRQDEAHRHRIFASGEYLPASTVSLVKQKIEEVDVPVLIIDRPYRSPERLHAAGIVAAKAVLPWSNYEDHEVISVKSGLFDAQPVSDGVIIVDEEIDDVIGGLTIQSLCDLATILRIYPPKLAQADPSLIAKILNEVLAKERTSLSMTRKDNFITHILLGGREVTRVRDIYNRFHFESILHMDAADVYSFTETPERYSTTLLGKKCVYNVFDDVWILPGLTLDYCPGHIMEMQQFCLLLPYKYPLINHSIRMQWNYDDCHTTQGQLFWIERAVHECVSAYTSLATHLVWAKNTFISGFYIDHLNIFAEEIKLPKRIVSEVEKIYLANPQPTYWNIVKSFATYGSQGKDASYDQRKRIAEGIGLYLSKHFAAEENNHAKQRRTGLDHLEI